MKFPFLAAALILTALPAIADTMHGAASTSDMTTSPMHANSMTGGSMSGGAMSGNAMKGNSTGQSHMTSTIRCKDAMHQVDAMMGHTMDQMKKNAAMGHMAVARADMAKGKDADCTRKRGRR